jgi:hypothetical protein
MKNTHVIFAVVLMVVGLVQGCKSPGQPEQQSETTAETTTPERFCFRNEFPFADNPSMKDIQELILSVEGDDVTGTYNWLPAEKDQRKGSLKGTIVNSTIHAEYTFMQEGVESATMIKIVFDEAKAEVSGGTSELGLDASMKKVACDEF